MAENAKGVVRLGEVRAERGLKALRKPELLDRARQLAVLKGNLKPTDYAQQVAKMNAEFRRRGLAVTENF